MKNIFIVMLLFLSNKVYIYAKEKFCCLQILLSSYRADGTNSGKGNPCIFTPFKLTIDNDTKVYFYQPY